MPECFAFYSQTNGTLPEKQMRTLAGEAEFTTGQNDAGGRTFTYRWPDLQITCHELPQQKLPEHLNGFAGWVQHLYGGQPDERGRQILERIRYTRLMVGVVLEPGQDEAGRADNLLGAMAYGLQAMIFYGNGLYDSNFDLILAPDLSFAEQADVLGPVADLLKSQQAVELEGGAAYQPTPSQQARFERARQLLNQHKVSTPANPLYVEDEDAVKLREPDEVARRVLVLSAVTLLADDRLREEALALIERAGLWDAVSPQERRFLEAEPTNPDLARKLLWRSECLWVLLWALGDIEDLGWPAEWSDEARIVALLREHEADPDFPRRAALRSKGEILDAVQLTMLVHWTVRDAWVHNRNVPEDLDWSGATAIVPVRQCPATGVVAERHHALNWLIRFGDADWDRVDTPT